MYCNQRVCMSVFPLAYLKNHVQISRNFTVHVTYDVALAPSDGNAIRYVRPVLWMTCFHIMDGIGQSQRRRVCFVDFARWQYCGRSLLSPTASC